MVFSFLFIFCPRYSFKQFVNKHRLMQIPVLFIGASKTAELVSLEGFGLSDQDF